MFINEDENQRAKVRPHPSSTSFPLSLPTSFSRPRETHEKQQQQQQQQRQQQHTTLLLRATGHKGHWVSRSQPLRRAVVVEVGLGVAQALVLRLVHLGLPFLGHRGLAAQPLEALQEDLVEEAVDDEVGGSVKGQQRVRELADALDEVGGLVVAQVEDGGHDGVGRDADEEGEDDDDHHDGDAVARVVLLVGARLAHGADDAGVERHQHQQRNDGAQQVLRPVVGLHERRVAPHLRQLHLQHDGARVRHHALHRLVPVRAHGACVKRDVN